MYTSTLTKKGQIVMPAPLRRKLGLEAGMKVAITETRDGVQVRPVNRAYFDDMAGMLSGEGQATQALLNERKRERADKDNDS